MIPSEDHDFEITFYEGILKKNPDFTNALIALGDVYTRTGRYKDGLKIDERLAKLKPEEPAVHYNLACSYSLLQMASPSLSALNKAIELGYRDFSFIQKDPDLEFIRKNPRYKQLISRHIQKAR